MIRLILIAAFVAVMAIVVIAIMAVVGTMFALADGPQGKDHGMLPGKLSRITYILLLILLFGVASGILGAA